MIIQDIYRKLIKMELLNQIWYSRHIVLRQTKIWHKFDSKFLLLNQIWYSRHKVLRQTKIWRKFDSRLLNYLISWTSEMLRKLIKVFSQIRFCIQDANDPGIPKYDTPWLWQNIMKSMYKNRNFWSLLSSVSLFAMWKIMKYRKTLVHPENSLVTNLGDLPKWDLACKTHLRGQNHNMAWQLFRKIVAFSMLVKLFEKVCEVKFFAIHCCSKIAICDNIRLCFFVL